MKFVQPFLSQASLFWLLTNQVDSLMLAVDDLLLDLAKGLAVHDVFGSFSGMAGFILMDRWDFVYYKWSTIDLAILQTTKTWVNDK